MERMEKDRTAKRVYVGKCAGSRPVGRQKKRWIYTVKECLRNRGLDVRQARRMGQDRSELWGVYDGECKGHNTGEEPQTLMRCHSFGLSQLYEAHGQKSVCC